MPTFGCTCGECISLVEVPNAAEASLVWDVDADLWQERRDELWRALVAALAAGREKQWLADFYGNSSATFSAEEGFGDVIWRTDSFSRAVVRCPNCGRLYVQRSHGENAYDCYIPEP